MVYCVYMFTVWWPQEKYQEQNTVDFYTTFIDLIQAVYTVSLECL